VEGDRIGGRIGTWKRIQIRIQRKKCKRKRRRI
jgi:hypothetical protein